MEADGEVESQPTAETVTGDESVEMSSQVPTTPTGEDNNADELPGHRESARATPYGSVHRGDKPKQQVSGYGPIRTNDLSDACGHLGSWTS